MNAWTRRDFTKTVIIAGATTTLGAARAAGANDRVRIGFIGLGNRGDQVLDAFLTHPDAEIVALCDLSPAYMDFAAHKIGGSPRLPQRLFDFEGSEIRGPRTLPHAAKEPGHGRKQNGQAAD